MPSFLHPSPRKATTSRASMVKQLSSKGQHFSTMSSRTADDHEQRHPPTDREELQEPRIKRQVRRRLHTTSRPFQERLLNMAEARREIVTALRIHRATLGQSRDQHEQEQEQEQQQRWLQLRQLQQQQVQLPPSISLKSLNCDAFFTNRLPDSHLAHFSSRYSSSTLPYPTTVALTTPPPPIGGLDHLACSFPAQPLGLNLNFQGFTGSLHDGKNSDDSFDRSLIQLSPSFPSYSACPSPLAAMFTGLGGPPAADTLEDASSSAALPHPVLEEMAAIYSIGERRSAELSELVHVDEPARRSEIVADQGMESGGGKLRAPARQDVAVGMPTGWPGSGEPDVALEMHLDGEYYYCHQKDGDGEDITLPCMEIGDIDGWNGEWFS